MKLPTLCRPAHLVFFALLALLGLLQTTRAHAQTLIKLDNQGTAINGYWYGAKLSAPSEKAPVIIALHGCGGMLAAPNKPNARTNSYAKSLNAQGWHVLFIDSLSTRGFKSICSSPLALTAQQRVTDVQAAVAYLAAQSSVDSARIGITGWSHGATTALLATDKAIRYPVALRGTFAFYPGCSNLKGEILSWQPARPVLMQLGAADDWTPPQHCAALANQWREWVQQDTYAGAHHGFDSEGRGIAAIHLNLPQGVHKTVHTGQNPAAKAASHAKLIAFFKEQFK